MLFIHIVLLVHFYEFYIFFIFLKSVVNNEFDSNAGIYYLIEAKNHQQNSATVSFTSTSTSANATLNNTALINQPPAQTITTTSTTSNYETTQNNDQNNNNINVINQNVIKVNNNHKNPEIQINEDCDVAIDQTNNNNLPSASSRVKRKSAVLFWFDDESSSTKNQITESKIQDGDVEKDDHNDDDEDDEMPIEELGKDYLSRFNNIRRHTIATNADNDKLLNQSNEIMKSTECLLKLNKQQKKEEELLFSASTQSQAKSPKRCSQDERNSSFLNDDPSSSSSLYINLPQSKHFCSHSPTHSHQTHHKIKHLHNNNSTNSNRLKNRTHHKLHQQQQQQHQNNNLTVINPLTTHLLSPQISPNHNQRSITSGYGRRASDGGSNISLFSQYYTLKNAFLNNLGGANYNAANNCGESSTIRTTYKEKSSELDQQTGSSSFLHQANPNFYKPRGSITSGIPIFSQLSNQQHQSSEEDEENSSSQLSHGQQNLHNFQLPQQQQQQHLHQMKYQRKNSKSRHEPYLLDALSNTQSSNLLSHSPLPNSNNNNNLLVNNSHNNTNGRTRQRELSISGTGSNNNNNNSLSGRYANFNNNVNFMQHRDSEPSNQLELILAHMPNLERIYNQSINRTKNSNNNNNTNHHHNEQMSSSVLNDNSHSPILNLTENQNGICEHENKSSAFVLNNHLISQVSY